MGKVGAHRLQPIEMLRSTRLQNQVFFYTPIHFAWPYPTGCRSLSLPRSFFVRGPKLEPIYPEHQTKPIRHFVKRNLHYCSQKVKDQAYKSLVRPTLEYGSTVWDPYKVYQKSWLEDRSSAGQHASKQEGTRKRRDA